MVSKRSITARIKARRCAIAIALPHDVVVNIIGLVAASSPQAMADLCNLRATYIFIYLQKYILLLWRQPIHACIYVIVFYIIFERNMSLI